ASASKALLASCSLANRLSRRANSAGRSSPLRPLPNFSSSAASSASARFNNASILSFSCFSASPMRPYLPSTPGEFYPQPLTDPYVNLSVHTARHSHAPASCENKPSLEVEALPGLPVGQVLR